MNKGNNESILTSWAVRLKNSCAAANWHRNKRTQPTMSLRRLPQQSGEVARPSVINALHASVVQWIERMATDYKMWVQFLLGVPFMLRVV